VPVDGLSNNKERDLHTLAQSMRRERREEERRGRKVHSMINPYKACGAKPIVLFNNGI